MTGNRIWTPGADDLEREARNRVQSAFDGNTQSLTELLNGLLNLAPRIGGLYGQGLKPGLLEKLEGLTAPVGTAFVAAIANTIGMAARTSTGGRFLYEFVAWPRVVGVGVNATPLFQPLSSEALAALRAAMPDPEANGGAK